MPELPEVETTCRGITPHLIGREIEQVVIRQSALRWPIAENFASALVGQSMRRVRRRAKYIILELSQGACLIHLGMSGSLRVLDCGTAVAKHDHVDIQLSGSRVLRYTDPRRFGSIQYINDEWHHHPLLADLGPEPLSSDFTGEYLWTQSRHRHLAIKSFIMHNRVVVGVGNIYANEALYRARIHPKRACQRISKTRLTTLVKAIKAVLSEAIECGGTTLRDFRDPHGKPGYFRMSLDVYGRAGDPCKACQAPIRQLVIGQRSTYYCALCQT